MPEPPGRSVACAWTPWTRPAGVAQPANQRPNPYPPPRHRAVCGQEAVLRGLRSFVRSFVQPPRKEGRTTAIIHSFIHFHPSPHSSCCSYSPTSREGRTLGCLGGFLVGGDFGARERAAERTSNRLSLAA
jgi:hypothetical protein